MAGNSLCKSRKNLMELKIEHKGLVDYEPCIKEMSTNIFWKESKNEIE